MIYVMDFGAFRFPMPKHLEFRKKYLKNFATIRSCLSQELSSFMSLSKLTYYVPATKEIYMLRRAHSNLNSIVGDLICVSTEAFEEMYNYYINNVHNANDLELISKEINKVTVYSIVMKKESSRPCPFLIYDDLLTLYKMKNLGFAQVIDPYKNKIIENEKNRTDYEN